MNRVALRGLAALAVLLPIPAFAGSWSPAGQLLTPRSEHTATLLLDGRLLVVGGLGTAGPLRSAELYDPARRTWSATGSLTTVRARHTATLLPNGRVLVAGGTGAGDLDTAEVYDPLTGGWSPVGVMSTARSGHTATLLQDGRVLIVGGRVGSVSVATAEIFLPASGTWEVTSPLTHARAHHTATRLSDGRVVVAGGEGTDPFDQAVNGREIYDPSSGTWAEAATFIIPASSPVKRSGHTSTQLADGRILSVGAGSGSGGARGSTELYDPRQDVTTPSAGYGNGITAHTATLVPDGRLLVVGGENLFFEAGSPIGESRATAALFDPVTETWAEVESLSHQRTRHTATLLANGRVLVVGGIDPRRGVFSTLIPGAPVADVEAYLPYGVIGVLTPQGTVEPPDDNDPGGFFGIGQTASLLPNGRVLIAGGPTGAALWDPATRERSAAAPPAVAHSFGTATLLPSGEVLLAGGSPGGASETYSPVANVWTGTGPLALPRDHHTATLLPDSRVLIVGGMGANGPLAAAEVFTPGTRTFAPTGSLGSERSGHTATLLPNGLVLVVGGQGTEYLASSELFDPATGAWTTTGFLRTPRAFHTATLLNDGRVFVAGGANASGTLRSAEIYDPASGSWTPVASMFYPRQEHTATLLLNGLVFLAGIRADPNDIVPKTDVSELYDPVAGAFLLAPDICHRYGHSATLLPDGRVAVFEGNSSPFPACRDQIYDGGFAPGARRPQIVSTSGALGYGTPFSLTGTNLRGDSEAQGGGTNDSAVNYPIVQVRSIQSDQTFWIAPDAPAPLGADPMTLTFSRLPAALNPGFHLVTAFTDGLPSLPAATNPDGLIGLGCSIAVTAPPVGQTVPAGASATFTVEAQGARTYQWQKDATGGGQVWLDIPGANEVSYTTPPVSGADSGALYRVALAGACAATTSSAARLTVSDSTPPTAAVVTPSGGEFWLLSPAGGPANTEAISWSMADDVRVCSVRVSLSYSDDGGTTYLPAPPDATLPRTFGSGGSCAFPGVTDTSLAYSLPSTFPSGKPGSLYKVQVEVFDQVGQQTVAASARPFYIVQSNPDVQTLIVTHSSRLAARFGAERAAALGDKLGDLTSHSRVQGVILDLAQVTVLDSRYAELDQAVAANDGTSPQRANELLFEAGGIHDLILARHAAFPGIRYVVLVGDDQVIPMARLADGTSLFPEDTYGGTGSPDLPNPGAFAAGQALEARTYLSDDPLALTSTVRPQSLGVTLFLPDFSVGRLAETPEEMTTTISTFLGQDGVLDLTTSSHKVLVTGYDFFSDSATLIRERWTSVFGAPGAVDGSLIGADWGLGSNDARRDALLARLCGNGGPRYGVSSLSGHATHFLEGVPSGSFQDIQGLSTESLLAPQACGGSGLDLSGGVMYALGCHGGLSVPGADPLDENHSVDLPQTFLSKGVVAYVANSGYGWGSRFGPGYAKRLTQLLTEQMTSASEVVIGDAVRRSKLRYFDQSSSLPDPYDEKTLMQWTLYGLPMYAVKTGIGVTAAGAEATSPALARTAPRPALERFGGVAVERKPVGQGQASRTALAAGSNAAASAALPPFLTALDLRFDFTAQGVYAKRGSAGDLRAEGGCSDPNGCYYTLNGLATGKTDLPVQPYFVYDSRLSGTSQHGVLWLGGTYEQEPGWIPVFTELVSNGGDGSDHGAAPGQIKIQPSANRRDPGADPQGCAASDAEINTLVVSAGDVLTEPGAAPYSTERRYRDVNLQALYFNNPFGPAENCDRVGPQLLAGPLPNGQYHQVQADGITIEWAVPATDPSGVWRTLVVVNDNTTDAQGRGVWRPIDLIDDGSGVFRGTFTVAAAGRITYVIQTVDNRGNVTWLNFVNAAPRSPVTGRRPGLAAANAAGVPSSGVPINVPLPVDVTLTGPAGPQITGFTPDRGIRGASVTIQGNNLLGASAVQFGGRPAAFTTSSASVIQATVPADALTGPITVTTPAGTANSAASFVVLPSLSIGNAIVTKPPFGTAQAVFTVVLDPAGTLPVTVGFVTADGTALAGTDYVATSGTLTFAPGVTTQTLAVPVIGNGFSGPDLFFFVDLQLPTNSGILAGRGQGTIIRPSRLADFDGDGKADLLWQNASNGDLAVWYMEGAVRGGVASFLPRRPLDANQVVSAVGDFNRDRHVDLVLQHRGRGDAEVWLLDGTRRTAVVPVAPARSAKWRVAGAADFDLDGGADLLWQHETTGAIEIWLMNGTAFGSSVPLGPARTGPWRVAGTGDFNGDMRADILWQNRLTGALEVAFLKGTTFLGNAPLSPSRGPGLLWALEAVADLTGEGKPDLVWRQTVTGEIQIWVLNGTIRTSILEPTGVAYPGEPAAVPGRVPDPRWRIVAPR